MKHILFHLYYWNNPNLIGKAIRNTKGEITLIYIDNPEEPIFGYNLYTKFIDKFYLKLH